MGFLFQNFALLENKTVKENLSLIKNQAELKYHLKALNRVGLSKEVNKKVYQLSGGEQQRVALARLMMKNVLLFWQMNLLAHLTRKIEILL